MKRDAVDFHEVPADQAQMHDRLENWGRACNSGSAGKTCAPMFNQFRSSNTMDAAPVRIPVGRQDATRLGASITLLPTEHRLGLQWYYVKRGSVMQGRKALACTAEALHRYVLDGRQMLINRGA